MRERKGKERNGGDDCVASEGRVKIMSSEMCKKKCEYTVWKRHAERVVLFLFYCDMVVGKGKEGGDERN